MKGCCAKQKQRPDAPLRLQSFSCCIFNDALFFLFCINLEFVKVKTRPAPLHDTACALSDW